MKKMLTITNNCKVFEAMRESSNVLIELKKDEYFEYKRIKKKNNNIWYQIIYDKSKHGYIKIRNGYVWEKGIVMSNDSYLIPQGQDFSNKVDLKKYAIIHFVKPHLTERSSYKIQTKEGVLGIVQSNFKILELDWFLFKTLHLLVFIVAIIISMIVTFGVGLKKTGVLMSLIFAAGIAFGTTVLFMIITMLIKFILFEIRIRR